MWSLVGSGAGPRLDRVAVWAVEGSSCAGAGGMGGIDMHPQRRVEAKDAMVNSLWWRVQGEPVVEAVQAVVGEPA